MRLCVLETGSDSGLGFSLDSLGDKLLKPDDAVKLTVPVLCGSPEDVGEMVDRSVAVDNHQCQNNVGFTGREFT